MEDGFPLPIHVPEIDAGDGLCTMVQPLLDGSGNGGAGAVRDYFQRAGRLFRLVTIDRAAVAVLPWNWETACSDPARRRFALQFVRTNAAAGVRTLVFHPHDSEAPLRIPHTIVLRTSLVRGRHGRHEHAMPWLAEGFAEFGVAGQEPRPFQPVPTVGFCGTLQRQHYRQPTLFRRLFRRHKNQYPLAYPHAPGLRAHAVEILRATPGIEFRFVEREQFMGGAVRADGTLDEEILARTRREFLDNLLESDYALCMRGAGNFSIRFSEILAVGRVPLFVDSSCVLPWPDLVDWRDVLTMVDIRDLASLGTRLLEEHLELGPEGFLRRQRRCREVWDRYVSPIGFFSTLSERLAANAL